VSGEGVDVCLIAEGNYPFVVGGVSQWIEMLLKGMPDLTFGLLAITAPGTPETKKYEFPDNLVEFTRVGIAQPYFYTRKGKKPGKKSWDILRRFHRGLVQGDYEPFRDLIRLIRGMEDEVLNPADMFQDYESFQTFMKLAVEMERFSPLIDTFYTWRSTHMPLLHALQSPLPKARCYHAVSTGYAGVVAAMGHILHDAPMLLTEHGIYTKEREMEVMRANWINDSQRDFWMRYFNGLSKIAYHFSEEIIALYETNRKVQVLSGAPEEKTRVIANGVDLGKYLALKRAPKGKKFHVGTVARVTPIKDVKTFIKACCLVGRERDDVEFHILGPEDESEGYADGTGGRHRVVPEARRGRALLGEGGAAPGPHRGARRRVRLRRNPGRVRTGDPPRAGRAGPTQAPHRHGRGHPAPARGPGEEEALGARRPRAGDRALRPQRRREGVRGPVPEVLGEGAALDGGYRLRAPAVPGPQDLHLVHAGVLHRHGLLLGAVDLHVDRHAADHGCSSPQHGHRPGQPVHLDPGLHLRR
jgi:glycosyltransferase involved in cell wall biosynthesis